jgi:transcriptional regulator with XRE-family HTH domain
MWSEDKKYEIGQRIREQRSILRYTQAQFAEQADISVNFLSEVENGAKSLSCKTLYNICDNIHLSADYILFGNNDSQSPSEKIIETASQMNPEELHVLIEYLTALSNLNNLDK